MRRATVAVVAVIATMAMSPGVANAAPATSATPASRAVALHGQSPERAWGIWDSFCQAFPRLCT